MAAAPVVPTVPRPTRPSEQVADDLALPAWPVHALFALLPIWFLLGIDGFMCILLAIPMLAALFQRKRLVLPKGFGFWLLFIGAVLGSSLSLDSASRAAGWTLRFGYFVSAGVLGLYVLNGGRSLSVWKVVRSITWLWIGSVVGGYLAFVLGSFSYHGPLYYVFPRVLLENQFIVTLVSPSFADVQDIIGFAVPRPTAPYNFTNAWGSMMAILTPFALVAASDRRVGFSPRLVQALLVASIVPAVVSLNRGLWLSLGVGFVYVAIRLGFLGNTRLFVRGLVALVLLVLIVGLSPLGDLIVTRVETGHSNADRAELIMEAVDGAAERPLLGWGAPRPNRAGLPSIGTHGQIWYLLFSHGVIGTVAYLGFFVSVSLRSWRQRTVPGLWMHAVVLIHGIQLLFYLALPTPMLTAMVAGMLSIRLGAGDSEA